MNAGRDVNQRVAQVFGPILILTGIAGFVIPAKKASTSGAPAYMSEEERRLYEREQKLLGLDPNECALNALHKKTIERCLDYLEADGLLPRRPTLREIFPLS